MVQATAEVHQYGPAARAWMPDHWHVALRGNNQECPGKIAVSLMNNTAFAMGQNACWVLNLRYPPDEPAGERSLRRRVVFNGKTVVPAGQAGRGTGKPAEGRACRQAGRAIPARLAPILERLQIVDEQWVDLVQQFGRWFHRAIGRPPNLAAEAASRDRRWLHGVSHTRTAFA